MNTLLASDVIEVGGLPLHPLIVHAVVILVPLTAAAAVLGTFWPAARRRLGVVTPLAALVVLILVPITIAAGQSLAEAVGETPAVEHHEGLGRMMLPWAVALFVVTAAQWAWYRWGVGRASAPVPTRMRVVTWSVGILAIAVAVGITVVVVLTGEAGAQAVWGSVG